MDPGKVIKGIRKFMKDNLAVVLQVLAVLIVVMSFLLNGGSDRTDTAARSLSSRISSRVQLLEQYMQQARIQSLNSWLSLEDLPQDMVIYRYTGDSLQSWCHQFPVADDEINASSTFRMAPTLTNSLDKPLVHTSLNDLSMLAFVEQQKWAINVALDMKGMYPLGVVTGFTAEDPSVVSVLELNPTVIGNLIKLDPIFTMFWPFTLDERDTREHRNIPCDGIDVESDSGKVWVLDDYTASGDDGPSVLNRIPSLADTFFPGINYGAINRIRVPDDGVLTPGEAEELLNSLTSAGLQKTEPKFVVMGREDCIWNTMHTSLNSAMDFYEEAVRAAGRGEER